MIILPLQVKDVAPNSQLDECRTEVLRTMTSVIYTERNARINTIVECLGALRSL